MKQPVAGVAPAERSEVTVMVVWPSIAAYPSGRFLGSLYSIRWPDIYIFRLGNLLALASIPHALALYFYRLLPSFFGLPWHGTFCRLTNRRVVEQKNEVRWGSIRLGGLTLPGPNFGFGVEIKSVSLDRFDSIEIVRRPGQEWFDAGDLIFRLKDVETFRLDGISRPEAFRQTCLKSQMAYSGVQQALALQSAK